MEGILETPCPRSAPTKGSSDSDQMVVDNAAPFNHAVHNNTASASSQAQAVHNSTFSSWAAAANQTPCQFTKDKQVVTDSDTNLTYLNKSAACMAHRSECLRQILLECNAASFRKTGLLLKLKYYARGNWIDFPMNVVLHLMEAFRSKITEIRVMRGAEPYKFDFRSMILIHLRIGTRRSLAWIDIPGNSYFPSFFLEDPNGPDDDNDWSALKDMSMSSYEHAVIPLMDDGVGTMLMQSFRGTISPCDYLQSEILTFSRDTEKFNELMRSFLIGMGTFAFPDSIVGIHRFVPKLGARLGRMNIFRQQIATTSSARDGRLNMRNAWFGTSKKGLFDLMVNGFHTGLGLTREGAYGTGVYLAPELRAYSCAKNCEPDMHDLQYMVMCRVIMGNIETVAVGSHRKFLPSSPEFDCGVDNFLHPTRYVVWSSNMNTNIHPDYVVVFRLTPDVREYLSELTGLEHSHSVSSSTFNIAAPNRVGSTAEGSSAAAAAASSPAWPAISEIYPATGNITPRFLETIELIYEYLKRGDISRHEFAGWIGSVVDGNMVSNFMKKIPRNTPVLLSCLFTRLVSAVVSIVPPLANDLLHMHLREYQVGRICGLQFVRKVRVILGDRTLHLLLTKYWQQLSGNPNSNINPNNGSNDRSQQSSAQTKHSLKDIIVID